MRRAWSGRLVVAVVALVVTACTGDDDTTPTTLQRSVVTTAPGTGPTTTVEAPDLTFAYFDAIAAGRPVPETVAVPGSDADVYARFRSVAGRLIGDGAPSVTAAAVTTETSSSTPVGIDVCDPECITYSQVSVEPTTGRLLSFAIDDVPLAGRVVGDGLSADDDGVIARITSAFRNQSGDVLIAIEVRNTTDVAIELFGFAAVYQPIGAATTREASGWWGTAAIDAGIGTDLLLAFDVPDEPGDTATVSPSDVSLGSGRVSLSGLRSDGVAIALDLTLPRVGG